MRFFPLQIQTADSRLSCFSLSERRRRVISCTRRWTVNPSLSAIQRARLQEASPASASRASAPSTIFPSSSEIEVWVQAQAKLECSPTCAPTETTLQSWFAKSWPHSLGIASASRRARPEPPLCATPSAYGIPRKTRVFSRCRRPLVPGPRQGLLNHEQPQQHLHCL